MELLVATWTLRAAIVAALAVGLVSYQAGASVIDCVDRALGSAVVFTLGGRWLIGALEPREKKLLRMRLKREKKRAKARKKPSEERHAAARARQASTVSRTA
jgi:hypothetical protein